MTLYVCEAEACNFAEKTFLHCCFSRLINCTNGTKLRKAAQIFMSRAELKVLEFLGPAGEAPRQTL